MLIKKYIDTELKCLDYVIIKKHIGTELKWFGGQYRYELCMKLPHVDISWANVRHNFICVMLGRSMSV